jgi:hypothetical protein
MSRIEAQQDEGPIYSSSEPQASEHNEIAQDLKVSQRRVQQIIREYKERWHKSVLGEKIERPAKSFDEKEAEAVRDAHACYRLGPLMLEPIISKQYKIRIRSAYHIIEYTCI